MSAALSVYLDVAAVAGTLLFACMILAFTLAGLAALGDYRLARQRKRPVGDDALEMLALGHVEAVVAKWAEEEKRRG